MNKAAKIALVIALVLIVAGIVFCTVAVQKGADIPKLIEEGNFSISFGNTLVDDEFAGALGYSSAESFEVEAALVERIEIAWVSGSVEVSAADCNNISAAEQASRTLKAGELMRWKLENGTLHIRYCSPDQKDMPSKQLKIFIPKELFLRELEVVTVSAETLVRGLDIDESLDCTGVSGNLVLEDVNCGRLSVTSVSGNILAGGNIRSLQAVNVSGRTEAELSGARELEIESVSGDVSLSLAQLPKETDIESVSGDVTLLLPKESEFELEFESGSGKLHCEFDTRGRGDVLAGISVETASGDLDILSK